VWKRHYIPLERMTESPPGSLKILGEIPRDADLLILCGLHGRSDTIVTTRHAHTTDQIPQAQESPFCAVALHTRACDSRTRDPDAWKRVNQVEPGVAPSQRQIPRRRKGAVLSSTNTTQRDRKTALVRLPR